MFDWISFPPDKSNPRLVAILQKFREYSISSLRMNTPKDGERKLCRSHCDVDRPLGNSFNSLESRLV